MNQNSLLGLGVFAFTSVLLMGQTAQKTPVVSAPKPATEAPKPATPARENGLYATIVTSMGSITVRLYEKESPITVKNFMDLSLGRKLWTDPKTGQRTKRPLYPGTIFHRVIPGFMIQGGDPTGTGMGGTDTIPDEFNPALSFDSPGKLAMANAGPGTGSCQFFITEVPTPHLDGRHTIFGQVVEGQDVVGQIVRVPRNEENNRPNTPVKIIRITFQRVGPGAPVNGPAPVRKPGTAGAASKSGAAKSGAAKSGTTPSATKK
jgi:peptidyl-prolyl cis-trans isomerase A (cyclophilin A)